jgi:hypothetical protein
MENYIHRENLALFKRRLAEASNESERKVLSRLLALELRITEKFDPAAFDKHAADSKEAMKADLVVDEQLEAGLVGGSFPISDPPSTPLNHRPPNTKKGRIENLGGPDAERTATTEIPA